MSQNRSITINILIAAFAMILLAGSAQAGVLLDESFDGTSVDGRTVHGGALVPGVSGQGWTSEATDGQAVPEFIEYALDGGLPPQGTLEFHVQRKTREAIPEEPDAVVELLDAEYRKLLTVVVRWNGFGDEDGSVGLLGDGLLKDLGNQVWAGNTFPIGNVPVGEWMHIAVTWGSSSDSNAVYVNGEQVSETVNIKPEGVALAGRTLSSVLAATARIRVGAEYYSDPRQTWSPVDNTVVDELKIHDVVMNPLAPAVRSVSHNAFNIAGYSGKLVAGDEITVRLSAEPDGTASFDIGDKLTGIPLTEDRSRPGTYVGGYTVKYGDDVEDGEVIGRFINVNGLGADPSAAGSPVTIDTRVYMDVNASNDLVPADESSRSGLTVVAKDANDEVVRGHELKVTLSTTGDYTGNNGGITFEDLVGGELDVDWGGVTDSFGEVTAQYLSGFAAKTILVSAKDMVSGDVGVGWVRSYIDGEVQILVTEPQASALTVAGSMDVNLSREWLTADGRSRSRITAVVKDADGDALSGHTVQFTLLGVNGEIRTVQGRTDSRGRAFADYIAGTVMGQVQVEVRDLTSGMTAVVSIELRPDAPAEIELAADPGEVVTGGEATVTATVTDANGNPNADVDVLYDVADGAGELGSASVATDEEGVASVTFTAGDTPGLVTVSGTVISREPAAEEISAAEGAVFLYGLDEDPGRLEVLEWLVEAGDEVVEGQGLVTLEDRSDMVYTIVAPRDGIVSAFVAEERDRVEYGDTLGYVIEVPE